VSDIGKHSSSFEIRKAKMTCDVLFALTGSLPGFSAQAIDRESNDRFDMPCKYMWFEPKFAKHPQRRRHMTMRQTALAQSPEAAFVLYPKLTPVQDRAFQLLGVSVRL
jgi:hypothetical protein